MSVIACDGRAGITVRDTTRGTVKVEIRGLSFQPEMTYGELEEFTKSLAAWSAVRRRVQDYAVNPKARN